MKNFLKRYGKDMNTMLVERLRKCHATGETSRLVEEAANEIERLSRALNGLPDGAIDGGWTAAGMSAYAAKLEYELKRAIRQNECDMLLTGDELRQCRAALRHNAEVSGAGTASAGLPSCATRGDE